MIREVKRGDGGGGARGGKEGGSQADICGKDVLGIKRASAKAQRRGYAWPAGPGPV